MPDLLSLFLAFILGVLVSRAIPERWWLRLSWAIQHNTPRPCAKCHRWHKTKDLVRARKLWSMNQYDQKALICHPCYDIEFRPFSAVIGKDKPQKEAGNDTTKPT